jgi:hypothetical protein
MKSDIPNAALVAQAQALIMQMVEFAGASTPLGERLDYSANDMRDYALSAAAASRLATLEEAAQLLDKFAFHSAAHIVRALSEDKRPAAGKD